MVQNLKKVLKSKISKFFSFLRHEVPFKAKNNREAVVVCAIHVVKRPSKRSELVVIMLHCNNYLLLMINGAFDYIKQAVSSYNCIIRLCNRVLIHYKQVQL